MNRAERIIQWRVEYTAPPTALRHCKKCGVKSEYVSSGLFRVNAQQKNLDVWLIYKCAGCDTTWNLTLFSRVNPKSLRPDILEGFHSNDAPLAFQYAMDSGLLRKNGAEAGFPGYRIVGEDINLLQAMTLRIVSSYSSGIRVATVLREKLGLSRRDFEQLLVEGKISSVAGQDLLKCRLRGEIEVRISAK